MLLNHRSVVSLDDFGAAFYETMGIIVAITIDISIHTSCVFASSLGSVTNAVPTAVTIIVQTITYFERLDTSSFLCYCCRPSLRESRL